MRLDRTDCHFDTCTREKSCWWPGGQLRWHAQAHLKEAAEDDMVFLRGSGALKRLGCSCGVVCVCVCDREVMNDPTSQIGNKYFQLSNSVILMGTFVFTG
jgi:hypothetical protein